MSNQMIRGKSIVVISIGAVVLFGAHLAARPQAGRQNQKQAQPEMTFIDFEAPPAELKTMAARSDLIVRAVVIQSGRPAIRPGSARLVGRHQTLRVLEVLKGGSVAQVGSVVTVFQYGGTSDDGGKEVSTKFVGVPLRETEEALLFLEKLPRGNEYAIAFGDAGMFRIDNQNDTVSVPSGARRFIKDFGSRSSMSRSEFLTIVRSAGKK